MENKKKEANEQDEERHNDRYRLQIELTPDSYRKLRQLRKRADVKTNAEVVRNALRLYSWFLEQKESDFVVLIAKEDEKNERYEIVKEVEIIF